MQTEIQIFNVGDRVVSKKLGALCPATVVGVMSAELYYAYTQVLSNARWEEFYPEWKDGMVAVLKYDEPVRVMGFDEYMKTVKETEITEELRKTNPALLKKIEKQSYEATVPELQFYSLPLDDIEHW
jgi:hypothetical protein